MRLAAALPLLVFAGTLRAEPMPVLDVDKACLTAGTARAHCVRREQFFYDAAALLWDDLSPAGQRYCIEKSEDTRQHIARDYYEALYGFVSLRAQIEQRDRDRVDPPRFQPR